MVIIYTTNHATASQSPESSRAAVLASITQIDHGLSAARQSSSQIFLFFPLFRSHHAFFHVGPAFLIPAYQKK